MDAVRNIITVFNCHKCPKSYRSKFWFDFHLKSHEANKIMAIIPIGALVAIFLFAANRWLQQPKIIIKSVECNQQNWQCKAILQKTGDSSTEKFWITLNDGIKESIIVGDDLLSEHPVEFSLFSERTFDNNLHAEFSAGRKTIIIKSNVGFKWRYLFWDVFFESADYVIGISNQQTFFSKNDKTKESISFLPPKKIKGIVN